MRHAGERSSSRAPSATASSSVASYRGAMRCHGTELGSSPSAHHSTSSSSFEAARVPRGSKRRSGRRRARNDGRAFEVDEDDARDDDVARDENDARDDDVANVALELAMDSDDDGTDIF